MAADNVSGAKSPTQKEMKADFDLHVLLIIRQDKVTKSVAQFRAWCEGQGGLGRRLAPAQHSADQGAVASATKP